MTWTQLFFSARPMTLRQLLFSPRGRLNRKDLWVGVSALYAMTMVLWLLVGLHFVRAADAKKMMAPIIVVTGWALAVLLILTCLYACGCMFAKRLRDVGLPGRLTLAPLGLFLAGLGLIFAADDPVGVTSEQTRHGMLLLLLWLALVLGVALKRGAPGVNRYGPPVSLEECTADDAEDLDEDEPDDDGWRPRSAPSPV